MTIAAAGLRIIEPPSGWTPIGWRELWEYRELFGFLVWRDVKVRYKQTVLGAAWAVLQPLTTMAMFTVLFGRWAKLPSDGVPYPLFAFAALLPWTFFANAVSAAAVSLVGNTHLISKVYFPRLLVSLAPLGTGLVDFGIALVMMFALCAVYGVSPSANLLLLPFVAIVAAVTAAGVGSFLAALCGVYRDVRYVVPLLMQLWMFASPVIYPASLVPASWQWLYQLNPMSGVIDGFRAALLGRAVPWGALASAAVVSVALAWIGAGYFRRVERRVADLL
jgi:homopolymeric O-antigen transport system permease protein